MEETGELPLAQELLAVGFSRQEVQAQRGGPIRVRLLGVGHAQVAQDLPLLFVRDAAVGLEPVPRAAFDQLQFLESPDDRLARHAEEVSEHDDVAAAEFSGPGGDFLKLLHDSAGRRQEGPRESRGVALLAGILGGVPEQHFGLPAVRDQVTAFMRGRLGPAVPGMTGVQEDAGAKRVVVGEEARDVAVEPSNIDTNAEVEFKQLYDVFNGADAEAHPLAEVGRILLGLHADVAAQDGSLRRIVPGALYAEKIFQLHFGAGEVRQQLGGFRFRGGAADEELSKARGQVNVHCLLAEERVHGGAVAAREPLQLVHPRASLALFHRDKGGARNVDGIRGVGLRDAGGFTGEPEAFAHGCRGYLFERRAHCAWIAQLATKELGPRDWTKAFHSVSCCVRSRWSRARTSPRSRLQTRLSCEALRDSTWAAAGEWRSAAR